MKSNIVPPSKKAWMEKSKKDRVAALDKPCACREPKRHRDCAYCGFGGNGINVCGRCRDEGIDGPVIRGTSRVVFSAHSARKS